MPRNKLIQLRRGTSAQWAAGTPVTDPILEYGEVGYDSTVNRFKVGDGTTAWSALAWFDSGVWLAHGLAQTLAAANKQQAFTNLGIPAYANLAAANLGEAEIGVPYYDIALNRLKTTTDIA